MTDRRLRKVLLVGVVVISAVLVASPATPGGADGNEAPGAPLAFRSITGGSAFSCGRLGDGSVKCWGGATASGQGDTMKRGDNPGEMGANLVPVALGAGRTTTALAAGDTHVCALLDNATVKCWGANTDGPLGLGDESSRGDGPGEMGDNLPAVALGTGRTATALAAGSRHTCALLDNANVKCWGLNDFGQLGVGDTTGRGDDANEMGDNLPAVDLGTGRTATALAAGAHHTCALLDNATVKCWGRNTTGQLGLGDTNSRGGNVAHMGDNLFAVDLGTGRTATAIVAGGRHTCALLDNATVKCWGQGDRGQLGQGDIANRGDAAGEMGDNLLAVNLGTGRTATALTGGDAHTCALLDNATLKCWGANASGQLGMGDTADRGDNFGEMGDNLPAVDVGTGRTVIAMTTGIATTCAIRDDNQLRCWGLNSNGQLGLGDTANRGDNAGEMGTNLPEVDLVGTGNGITGRVTSTVFGNGVPGAWIAVMSANDFSLVRRLFTNGDGNYAAELPAGNYHLFVLPLGTNLTAGFHGSPTTVPVTTGLTVANPALASPAATGTISGTIHEESSANTVGQAWVIAINDTGVLEKATTADNNGDYTLSLRPGTYYLVAVDRNGFHDSRFHPSTTMLPGSTPVVVTSNNNSTADITLPGRSPGTQSATITGQVTGVTPINGSTNLNGIWVLALRASDFSMAHGAITNSTGNYTLTVPPGNYHVGFIDPTGQRPMEWWNDQPASNLAGATTITAPQTAINPVLPLSTGAISGTVRRGATGWTGVWAIALGPTGVAGMDLTFHGTYTISGLTPGNYRMMYIDPAAGPAQEFYEDQADYNAATPIVVTADTTTLNISPDINSPP